MIPRSIFDGDHEAFRQVIRDFIAREVVGEYPKWEKHGAPREIFHKLGRLGITGFGIPEEFGGPGDPGYKYSAIVAEEAGRAGIWLGHYTVSTIMVLPYLIQLSTEDQKKRWLPSIASGDSVLCVAMTEPNTGSDLAGIRCTAKRPQNGDTYVLNGSKTFITGAHNSELCVVVARTSPPTEDNRRGGLSLFVLDTATPGFHIGRTMEKIGLHSLDTSELTFDNVEIPADNLLGEEGKAFEYLSQNLPCERITIAVSAAAAAEAAMDWTRQYVASRSAFGRSISDFQNTKFTLASAAARLLSVRTLVDKGIELQEAGDLSASVAAAIKLEVTEAVAGIIDTCLQLHGGYGYMTEYPISRLYVDARVNRIYGGTSEIMKTVIAKDLGI